eukprot:190232_1
MADNHEQSTSIDDVNKKPSRIKQYWQHKMLYNGPMIIDLCDQPKRFLFIYYFTYYTASPFIKWLKHASINSIKPHHTIESFILTPLRQSLIYSYKTIYKYLCPSIIKEYIINPFDWTPYHYQLSYLFISSIGCLITFIYSYLYFNKSLNDRLEWPYVYDYMMNKNFSICLRNLLNNYPLNDTFHIDLTVKLYPIICKQQQEYLNNTNHNNNEYRMSASPRPILSKVYELKIVQFTAANVAWYSTKWNKTSIQRKNHRIVGVFLCDYNINEGDEQKKIQKTEIRETIIKIKKTRLNDLNILNKLDWCKNMCLTLQTHFHGHWVVIIGHRAQYRSFHSVILNNNDNNNDYQQSENMMLNINNKTDAEYFHFGFGPKWYNWSCVIAKIS